jgi:hypothetical protein
MDIDVLGVFHKLAFPTMYVFFIISNRKQSKITTHTKDLDVLAILMAWWITFTLVITVLMTMGFGPGGVLSGKFSHRIDRYLARLLSDVLTYIVC